MEKTVLDIFGHLLLLASAILENALSVKFVDKLNFEGDRMLSKKQQGVIWAAVGIASLLEFANKEMGIYYSIGMLGIQLLLIEASILAVRRRKVISTTCVLVVFFAVVQTAELLVEIALSAKVLESQYMLAVYEDGPAYLTNIMVLVIRLAVWIVYRMIRMRAVRINHPILLGGASIAAYMDMYYLFLYADTGKNRVEIRTSSIALGAIVLILTVLIVSSLYYVQKEKSMEIKQRDMVLEGNYTKFYNLYNENRYLSHDLKNHLNILEDYMRHKEYEKAYDYMTKLREPILRIEQYSHSGNRIIDMVLNDKFAEAERENIKVNQRIATVGEIEISDQDLCTMLSNLLDNALEACQKCTDQEPWIDVSLRKIKNGLILKVSNSVHEKNVTATGKYSTTKGDKKRHGVGLESVNYVLKKYDGNIKIESDDKMFSVSIVIFLYNEDNVV